MKRILILVFSSCSSILGQKIKAEKIYQECVYNTLNYNGKELKIYTKQFEKHLIKSKILKDTTSKSYFELFKTLGTEEWKKYNYNYSYIDSINKITSYRNVNLNKHCVKAMRNHENFEKSKFFSMKSIFLEEHKTVEAALKKMSQFLDENDFELDFYKYRTLFYLEHLTGYPKDDTMENN